MRIAICWRWPCKLGNGRAAVPSATLWVSTNRIFLADAEPESELEDSEEAEAKKAKEEAEAAGEEVGARGYFGLPLCDAMCGTPCTRTGVT